MKETRLRTALKGAFLLAVCDGVVPTLATAKDGPWEHPAPIAATAAAPAPLVKGPHHTLASPVAVHGYLYHFELQTTWGPLTAEGIDLLTLRVRELEAVKQLSETSSVEVAGQAAATTVVSTGKAVGVAVTNPGETVAGIPGGVKRLFGKGKKTAESAAATVTTGQSGAKGPETTTADKAGDLALMVAGVKGAHRKWAQKLGIDPYTTNPLLRKQLDRVASVDSATSKVTSFAIPGAIGMVGKVSGLVWAKDPTELAAMNRAILEGWGVPPADIKGFLANRWWTPSRQTAAVAALNGLAGIPGRELVIQASAGAESETETAFLLSLAQQLATFHTKIEPLTRLAESGRLLPVAVTKTGRRITLAPADHLPWSQEIAGRAAEKVDDGGGAGTKGAELWVGGTVSEQARRELEALGWKVVTGARERLAVSPTNSN